MTTSTQTQTQSEQLLKKLADDGGFETITEMLERHTVDSVASGICTNCELIHNSIEPDADGYECEDCGEPCVQSSLVIAGVI